MTRSNPWALEMCEDNQCAPCNMAGKKNNCRKRNLVYEMRCKSSSSSQTGPGFVYVGETARSSKERVAEHIDDLNKQSEKTHMLKHQILFHKEEEDPNFSFKVVKHFRSSLERQIYEAVHIKTLAETEGLNIMNSKGEYSRCRLPRLIIEGTNDDSEA